ncbi:hypothetical protein [Streptomyces sp. C8S0]|nr:hypothetical protein [Streptomyces sp. C8S0]
MSGVPVAPVAPNALPLVGRLTDTPYGSKTSRSAAGEAESPS